MARTDAQLAKARRRAAEASRIIDDPMFREAVIFLEAQAMTRLLELDPTQDLERFREVERLKVIRDIRAAFLQAIQAGKEPTRMVVV